MDVIFDIVSQDRLLSKLAKQHHVVAVLRRHSTEILGQLEKDIVISDVRETSVIFETTNPLWVSEIKRYEKMILGRLRSVLHNTFEKQSPKIMQIKVIISPHSIHNKAQQKKIDFTPNLACSLEDLIREENKRKKEKGFSLCTTCGDIYTDQQICVFCRTRVAGLSKRVSDS